MSGSFYRSFEVNDEDFIEIEQREESDVSGVIWDSALVAVHAFIQQGKSKWKGKKVLELGAGTGVCGLILAALGADVTLTDLSSCVPLIERNIERNEKVIYGNAAVKTLDWTTDHIVETFDVLLMVDCIYYSNSIDPLIELLKAAKVSEILCVYEKRDIGEPVKAQKMFFDKITEFFTVSPVPIEDLHPDYRCPEDIPFLRLVHKHDN